jgi:methionyl-tRNA formyltransferase
VGEPDCVDALAKAGADVGVVVAFGQFIPRPVRELPHLGYLINAHASLLPRHRGAAPIAQAILDGDARTGISVMRVERRMDAGPVALVRETEIGEQENSAELTARLSLLAADAIEAALDRIAAGTVAWKEQDHARATVAPKLEKRDGRLDWRSPTEVLVRRIHGLAPRPGAFTYLPPAEGGKHGENSSDRNGDRETLRILRVRAARPDETYGQTHASVVPGTVRLGQSSDEPAMRIATGDGWLVPLEVQRAGGKTMETAAFLRGREIDDGCELGGEPVAPTGEGGGSDD